MTFMNKVAIALGIALCWLPSFGQIRGSAGTTPRVSIPHLGASNGLTISFGAALANHHFRRNFFPSSFFFDPGFWYEPGIAQPASPEILILPIQVTSPEPKQESRPVDPLLIERRGDRFVRTRPGESGAESPDESVPLDKAESFAKSTGANRLTAELPSAVLVFRDGHCEQTASYAIVGSDMFLYFDDLTAGSWSRKIRLADLDLSATAAENHERGSKFQLPRAANEIVIRP